MSRKAFFRYNPTPTDLAQNEELAGILTRMNTMEGRSSSLEVGVALKASQSALDDAVLARQSAIVDVSNEIQNQSNIFSAALNEKASLVELGVATTARQSAVTQLVAAREFAINSERSARNSGIDMLEHRLADAVQLISQNRVSAMAALSNARTAAIGDMVDSRIAALGDEAAARTTALGDEAISRADALALKSDKTYVDETLKAKTDAAARVTAENAFLTAFKDALYLETSPNTDVEFNYSALLEAGAGSGSAPTPAPAPVSYEWSLYASKQYAEGLRIIVNSFNVAPNTPIQFEGEFRIKNVNTGEVYPIIHNVDGNANTSIDSGAMNFPGFEGRANIRYLLASTQIPNDVQHVLIAVDNSREITQRFTLTNGMFGAQTYLD